MAATLTAAQARELSTENRQHIISITTMILRAALAGKDFLPNAVNLSSREVAKLEELGYTLEKRNTDALGNTFYAISF